MTVFGKIRSLLLGVLWGSLVLSPPVVAEEGFGQYQYQTPGSADSGYSGYQWRPSANEYSYRGEEVRTFRDGSEILSNPPQPGMTLPPGTYRPMEETNRIPSQVGAYRFRHFTPAEQSRIDRLEQRRNKDNRNKAQTRYQYRGGGAAATSWSSESARQPLFRPDERFGTYHSGQSYQNYPYQSQHTYSPSDVPSLFRQDR